MREMSEEEGYYENINKNLLRENGFWGSVGVGAIIYSRNTKRFLIGYRSEDVHMGSTWSTFGGSLDGSVSIIDALFKELYEELGFIKSKVRDILYLYAFKRPNFIYHNHVVIVNNEFVPFLNWENSDYKWVTLEEMINMNDKHIGLEEIVSNNSALDILNSL